VDCDFVVGFKPHSCILHIVFLKVYVVLGDAMDDNVIPLFCYFYPWNCLFPIHGSERVCIFLRGVAYFNSFVWCLSDCSYVAVAGILYDSNEFRLSHAFQLFLCFIIYTLHGECEFYSLLFSSDFVDVFNSAFGCTPGCRFFRPLPSNLCLCFPGFV